MTGYKMPMFMKGNLLTQDMLNALKEYELQISESYFAGYSDGIITGLDIQVTKGVIYIGKGIVKYQNRLFFIPDNTTVQIQPIDAWQTVRLVFGDIEITKTFAEQDMEIEVSRNTQHEEKSIEICRVRLQDGARLRSDYRNFEDMKTEFDTVNVIEAQWAAYGKESISPVILREFAKEAEKCTLGNQQDMMFVQQILNQNGKALNRELIEFYLNNRQEKKNPQYTNIEIYQGLCNVLKQIKTGKAQTTENRRPRRVLVDY